jgi:predicted GNAT family acetyltransferase
MSEGTAIAVVHNKPAQRFEAQVDGGLAVAEYVRAGDTVTFTHTFVPEQLRHRGIASAVAQAALDTARAEGWHVIPRCPFIAAFIAEHPEYRATTQPVA